MNTEARARPLLRLGFVLGLALATCACDPLVRLEENVCGNGAVEAGEDCDTYAPPGMSCTAHGGPNPCRWSCAALSDGARPKCKDGWGCGGDGLCRRPSGEFSPVGEPIAAGAFSVAAGDFDGDGRKDLLTRGPGGILVDQARVRLHFFDSQAALATTRLLAEPMIAPVVSDADGDGLDDLVCGMSVGGVLTWKGTGDRQLLPLPSPFAKARSLDLTLVPLAFPVAETRYLALTPVARGLELCELGKEDIPLAVVGPASRYQALSGPAAVGPFADKDSTACDAFALAFDGENAVTVYRPCTRDDLGYVQWRDGLDPVQVAVKDPVYGGVRAVDLNDDGHLDLLVGVQVLHVVKGTVVERFPLVTYAYGDGKGHFASSLDKLSAPDDSTPENDYLTLPVPERLSSGEIRILQYPLTELPLATGDVSGDGLPDFVMTWGILTSHTPADGSEPYYLVEDRPLHGSWTQAVVADLNGDGRLDVVAATSDSFYLDFLEGTGTSQLVASTISTSGTVSQLVVGDLDGDLVSDVLFVQAASSPGAADQLYVAFGQPLAPPLAPTMVGEIPGVRAAFATEPRPMTVALVSAASGDSTATVTRLLGSPSRQPFAPSFLTRGLPSESDVPLLVTAGAAPEKGGPRDLLAFSVNLASESDPTVPILAAWAAQGTRRPVELRPAPDLASDEWPVAVTQADLDGKPGDEVALLTAGGIDVWGSGDVRPQPGHLHLGRLEANLGAERPTASWAEASPTLDLSPASLGFELVPTLAARLAAVDLDGDGALDLVVSGGVRANEPTAVAVLFNDGHGGFDPRAATRLEPSARAFATVHDRVDGPPSLVYATRSEVRRVRAQGRSLGTPETLFSGLTEGTGIAAGDVDGDGVEDLAVVDDQSLRVLKGGAAKP